MHWCIAISSTQYLHLADRGARRLRVRSTYPHVRVALRSDSLAALIKAVAAGIGIAVLPRFAAAQNEAIEQISAPLTDVSMPVWLLSHPDSRGNARVRALTQFLVERIPRELGAIVTTGACRQDLCNAQRKAAAAPSTRARNCRPQVLGV